MPGRCCLSQLVVEGFCSIGRARGQVGYGAEWREGRGSWMLLNTPLAVNKLITGKIIEKSELQDIMNSLIKSSYGKELCLHKHDV